MQEFENNMHLQVLSLPALMREQYADLEAKVRTLFSTPEIFSLQRIILTGCGDSHAAAMAMKYAIEALTGLPLTSCPPLSSAASTIKISWDLHRTTHWLLPSAIPAASCEFQKRFKELITMARSHSASPETGSLLLEKVRSACLT